MSLKFNNSITDWPVIAVKSANNVKVTCKKKQLNLIFHLENLLLLSMSHQQNCLNDINGLL